MDAKQAEIEALKGQVRHWESAYRESVREIDTRDRLITELKTENSVLKGQIRRMQIDRNSEE